MMVNDLIKTMVIFGLLLLPSWLFSNILSDLTSDHEIQITIYTKDVSTDASSDQKPLRNWKSDFNFFIEHRIEMGASGTRDYLDEQFIFNYGFPSKSRHAFTLRTFHLGYAPGIFSGHFTFYHFAILSGFEYLYKIFNNRSGFFTWTAVGGCNQGIAAELGFGIGSRMKDGIELDFLYLHNVGFFSRLDFYFIFFEMMTLRGRFGLDFKFHNLILEVFTFSGGLLLGVLINRTVRLELGGGFTLNEYSYFNGYGEASLALFF